MATKYEASVTRLAEAYKVFGRSAHISGLIVARGGHRWAASLHSPVGVATDMHGGTKAVCSGCRPVRDWPCDVHARAMAETDRLDAELAALS